MNIAYRGSSLNNLNPKPDVQSGKFKVTLQYPYWKLAPTGSKLICPRVDDTAEDLGYLGGQFFTSPIDEHTFETVTNPAYLAEDVGRFNHGEAAYFIWEAIHKGFDLDIKIAGFKELGSRDTLFRFQMTKQKRPNGPQVDTPSTNEVTLDELELSECVRWMFDALRTPLEAWRINIAVIACTFVNIESLLRSGSAAASMRVLTSLRLQTEEPTNYFQDPHHKEEALAHHNTVKLQAARKYSAALNKVIEAGGCGYVGRNDRRDPGSGPGSGSTR